MSRTAAITALERLVAAVGGRPSLEPLAPAEYAIAHALFEARSDQRANVVRWLVGHLGVRAVAPTRVLSIGCGDGSVDVYVAAALAALGHRVDYVGVEPHSPSGRRFSARLDATAGVRPTLLATPFDAARPEGRFDIVLAVHSLYYVDLASTLRRACSLLATGGEVVILHAPREPLNSLTALLCPGHRQPFVADVVQQLHTMHRPPLISRIDSRLDLSETGDPDTDRRLLEFTVQAQLPAPLAPLVRAALAEQALPEPGLLLAHPVDAPGRPGPRRRCHRRRAPPGRSVVVGAR